MAIYKPSEVRAVENVAKHIHPAIFEGYLGGTLLATLKEQTRKYLAENVIAMSPEEAG